MRTQDSTKPIPTVVVSSAPNLGDARRPFSLAMWIKPAAHAGVLAHVSATAVGTGWCMPFLGYDLERHLVAQLFHGDGPRLGSFDLAVDSTRRPIGRWTQAAMTWAPEGTNKLYVSGVLAAESKPPRYHAAGAGRSMYVAWGSSNIGGSTCWHGAIAPG